MKRLSLWALATLVALPGFPLAQEAAPTVGKAPVTGNEKPENHSHVEKTKKAIARAYAKVTQALQAGEITQDQATELNSQILAVRRQLDADIRQNRAHRLTSSQEAGLNADLNQALSSIP